MALIPRVLIFLVRPLPPLGFLGLGSSRVGSCWLDLHAFLGFLGIGSTLVGSPESPTEFLGPGSLRVGPLGSPACRSWSSLALVSRITSQINLFTLELKDSSI